MGKAEIVVVMLNVKKSIKPVLEGWIPHRLGGKELHRTSTTTLSSSADFSIDRPKDKQCPRPFSLIKKI